MVDPLPPDAAAAREDDEQSLVESQQPLTAASLLQFLSRDDVHRQQEKELNAQVIMSFGVR